jgi:hypothetical protein
MLIFNGHVRSHAVLKLNNIFFLESATHPVLDVLDVLDPKIFYLSRCGLRPELLIEVPSGTMAA